MTTTTHDEYLGDGVTATYDGWHIWLSVQPRPQLMRIGLAPEVMDRLIAYREKLRQAGEYEE